MDEYSWRRTKVPVMALVHELLTKLPAMYSRCPSKSAITILDSVYVRTAVELKSVSAISSLFRLEFHVRRHEQALPLGAVRSGLKVVAVPKVQCYCVQPPPHRISILTACLMSKEMQRRIFLTPDLLHN